MDLTDLKKQKWVRSEEPIFIKQVQLPKDCVGWLVVDSIGSGITSGGIRLGEKVNLEEVKLLAKEMTLKRLFYKQTVGGAKAGIYCPNPLKNSDREEIFKKFGKVLKPLFDNKIYYPGTDLGTNQKDIDDLLSGAGIVADYGIEDNQDYIDSSYYTAVSVFSVLKSIVTFKKIKLKNTRIGIQGLGKVGLKLLHLASEHGIKFVAGSTRHGALYSPQGLNTTKIFNLVKKHGDEFVNYYNDEQKISFQEFFEKDMDILCPCAGIYPINNSNVDKIQAKIIVPGCNVAATEKVENQLYKRGILYLPGFVCNAGGVLGYTMQINGIDKEERSTFLSQGIQLKVRNLLERAKKSEKSPTDIARDIVLKNNEKFALESKVKIKGKFSFAMARLINWGPKDILRIFLWKLIQRNPLVPDFMRRHHRRKILYERLFNE